MIFAVSVATCYYQQVNSGLFDSVNFVFIAVGRLGTASLSPQIS